MGEKAKNTTEFSILNLDGTSRDPEETEVFFTDLNLLQVIDWLTLKWGRDVRKYYLYFPMDAEAAAYRRAVYGDVKKDVIYRALMTYMEQLAGIAVLRGERERVSNPLQQAVWKVREATAFCEAYEALSEALAEGEPASAGMREFARILAEYLAKDSYLRMKETMKKVLEEIRSTRFVITCDKDRIRVELREVVGEGAYEEWLSGAIGSEVTRIQNPFAADIKITELENECLEILREKKPALFRALTSIPSGNECETPVLHRFSEEIRFYLSFAGFQREMEAAGFAFATPDTSEEKRMEAKGLYDLALALNSIGDGRSVVSNDFTLDGGERFFVLTGPNQGGKTTFARSLGQLVYLTKMGLDVPAVSANVPFFPGILTHFSVEESVETGRGKLMDELVRLAPMMRDDAKGSFVVINELFTTAANYDAQVMGKRVLEHFIGCGCKGIYVTHIKELADEREGVVSLRAILDEKGVPTFLIRRGEAEDGASAAGAVNKYRLTYEQLKERL
ncbi:MAG: hypothetical protein J5645_05055 [Lachnospiraceae bacterium]|nr:hypothetical protein [Lachnospiraceae bacterium]